jgi:GntR family transcriptional regulator, transcriptional repressor for pyruvate dehydrogenase complex
MRNGPDDATDAGTPAVASAPADEPRITVGAAGGIFRPLKAAETVARDVVADILRQGLRTGDALPNEASMIEHYGVSRESLREGLRLLETQGLITIKRGPRGGPLVGSVDPANIGRMTTLYYRMAGASYTELLEAWQVAETLLAERAARHPDATLRQERMEPYLGDHPSYDSDRVDEFVTMHAGFHEKLGTLAGNRVLELTLQSYGLIVSHHIAQVGDPRKLYNVLVHDHRSIARAVAAGHANKARDEMARHIGAVIDASLAGLGEKAHGRVEWL